jgi:uncharacterized protein YkwD
VTATAESQRLADQLGVQASSLDAPSNSAQVVSTIGAPGAASPEAEGIATVSPSATPEGTSTPTPGPGTPTATPAPADSATTAPAETAAAPGATALANATNPTQTPTPAESTLAAAAAVPPTVQPTTQAPPTEFSAQVVNLVNEYRQKNGLGRLRANPQITSAALAYAKNMAENDFFAHAGKDGSTPQSRLKAAGYAACFDGENISAGQTSAIDAVNAWKNSESHNKILLAPDATEIGVGYYYSADSYYKHYWVLDLGRPANTC